MFVVSTIQRYTAHFLKLSIKSLVDYILIDGPRDNSQPPQYPWCGCDECGDLSYKHSFSRLVTGVWRRLLLVNLITLLPSSALHSRLTSQDGCVRLPGKPGLQYTHSQAWTKAARAKRRTVYTHSRYPAPYSSPCTDSARLHPPCSNCILHPPKVRPRGSSISLQNLKFPHCGPSTPSPTVLAHCPLLA